MIVLLLLLVQRSSFKNGPNVPERSPNAFHGLPEDRRRSDGAIARTSLAAKRMNVAMGLSRMLAPRRAPQELGAVTGVSLSERLRTGA